MFGLLFMALLPRRFCALTERLCPSTVSFADCGSPQAFRERLEPKLFSLAFYPKYSYVIFLPIIMNCEL
jgi:hypothetical protein